MWKPRLTIWYVSAKCNEFFCCVWFSYGWMKKGIGWMQYICCHQGVGILRADVLHVVQKASRKLGSSSLQCADALALKRCWNDFKGMMESCIIQENMDAWDCLWKCSWAIETALEYDAAGTVGDMPRDGCSMACLAWASECMRSKSNTITTCTKNIYE